MKSNLLGAVLLSMASTVAFAQTDSPPAKPGETPAIATPDEQNPAAPVTGENSFTEDQAKARIVDAGYSNVSEMRLDESGVWRAKAVKDGKPVAVALDFQGNIVAN